MMIRKIFSIVSLIVILASASLVVKAVTVTTPKINPVTDNGTIYLPGANTGSNQGQVLQSQFLPSITKFVIGLTGALSLLFVIVGAIQMLTAFGNDEGLGTGKKTITWALVGLVISLLSFAIVQVISSINLDIPQKDTGNNAQTTSP